MSDHAARLIIHDHEMHLEHDGELDVGDTVEVIRGNGPREGDRMGTATVTDFEHGSPVLDVRFDGQSGRLGH
jgi:hypothetical protein